MDLFFPCVPFFFVYLTLICHNCQHNYPFPLIFLKNDFAKKNFKNVHQDLMLALCVEVSNLRQGLGLFGMLIEKTYE